MRTCFCFRPLLVLTFAAVCGALPALGQADSGPPGGGELRILDGAGQPLAACPLKHTGVQTDIAGFFARTTVKQTFQNSSGRKIEAIYVFPLPQHAAVDDMVMTVGERRVIGEIKKRAEARQIYEASRAAGHVASLLDQERPNIFTQSVANIDPGAEVTIEISYVETLKYEDGVFEFVFPMVVGPRYIPGGGSAPAPMTTGTPTPQVPDADRITPPVTPKGTRAGHDISITVRIDAGLELHGLDTPLHAVDVRTISPTRAAVTLKNQAEIPNRDFVLRYSLASDDIGHAFLTHQDARGGFFALIMQPPKRVVPKNLMSRELIFVLDTSGSMHGFPIEKAKALMSRMIDTMRPGDTFNMITFSGDTRVLWESPRPNTDRNRAEAQGFLSAQRGSGGTEMMKAISAALVQTGPQVDTSMRPMRICVFMTDGYVGNDMAIIDAVKKNAATTRVFSFGIGNSVNRYLLDGMASAGRGEVEYVNLRSGAVDAEADAAVERFHERVLAPVLTDIAIDWGTLPVADIYPPLIPDLFSSKPMVVFGRLTGPASGTLTLRGNTGSGPYAETIALSGASEAAADATPHPELAALWAREKIEHLMNQDLTAAQQGNFPEPLKNEVTSLGIEFRLMTQFTSFVAVEEMSVTIDGQPTKVLVPVEMPDSVSYEGVFGDEGGRSRQALFAAPAEARAGRSNGFGGVSGRPAPRGGARGKSAAGGGRQQVQRPKDESAKEAAATPLGESQDRDQDGVADVRAPREKLDEALRDLAAKVEKEGQAGNLDVGNLRVKAYKLNVMIQLSQDSEGIRKTLKDLGFELVQESKTVLLLIGSVDVRKLEEIAKLDAVQSIRSLPH